MDPAVSNTGSLPLSGCDNARKLTAGNVSIFEEVPRWRDPQDSCRILKVCLVDRPGPRRQTDETLASDIQDMAIGYLGLRLRLGSRQGKGGPFPGPELAHRPDVSQSRLRKGAYGRHLALLV